jgi:hypothetical protein
LPGLDGVKVKKRFSPGQLIPESGIYRVEHNSHRLMHEATLLEGDLFPLCRQCKYHVRFELRRSVKNPQQLVASHNAILEDFPGLDVDPPPNRLR